MKLHFLSSEEEAKIKQSIPWETVDPSIRDLVLFINKIEGIATVQSCGGHIKVNDGENGFYITDASVCIRTTEYIMNWILFDLASEAGIRDVEIRYFRDGTFWLKILVDPSQRSKLYKLFRMIKGE